MAQAERLAAGAALCAALAAANPAFALRPFDSTDADVSAPGDFELELGPVGWLREASKRTLIAPAAVGNFGLQGDRELVVQGRREMALDRGPGEPRSSIDDNGLFMKQVLRRGVLQDAPGPSVATEYGALLPSVHGEKGTGASVAWIVSQRTDAVTVHLNAAFAWTRKHEPDLFLGAVIEGPHGWTVRPVAEVFGEQTSASPRTTSRLAGAIWRVSQDLSFDAGIRGAHEGGENVRELRLGLTWIFSLGKEP